MKQHRSAYLCDWCGFRVEVSLSEITVGILAPEAETRQALRTLAQATGMARVQLEVAEYCASRADRVIRRFVEANPEVIVVDMEQPEAALQALQLLNWALPQTWLFVTSSINDPQLIIETMRSGAREFLHQPSTGALAVALRRYAQERNRARQDRESGEIYCVTSAKGGSGTTSVAINLAAVLSELPSTRVALIDLNSPIGDAAAYLNLKPQYTFWDAVIASSRLDPVLLENLMTSANGIGVLPGPKEFRPNFIPPVEALGRIFEVATNAFRYVLVDLPPSLHTEHFALVSEMSAGIVVVLTPDVAGLWRTARLLTFLQDMGAGDKLRLLVNRTRKSDEISDADIEKALNQRIYGKLPNNDEAAVASMNAGKPVASLNHSELARSYKEFAYRLAGTQMPGDKRKGIFGLFSLGG